MKLKSLLEGILKKSRRKFLWSKFTQLKPDQLEEYADSSLKMLGMGSSRAVYALTSKKVLKVAKGSYNKDKASRSLDNFSTGSYYFTPGAGAAQNKAEVDAWTTPSIKPIAARIYDFDKNFNWIISELTNPIGESIHLINKWLGEVVFNNSLDFDEMMWSIMDDKQSVMEWFKTYRINDEPLKVSGKAVSKIQNFIDALFEFSRVVGLQVVDFTSTDQFGITADGRLIVVDYGFTREVQDEYYGGSRSD